MTRRPTERRRGALLSAALAGMLLLIILFASDDTVAPETPQLTTHSRAPSGARGFYETAARLRWVVVRNEQPRLPPPSTEHVYAHLAPGIPLTPAETHELLGRVRAGAGLFAVLRGRSPLSDSLGVRFRGRYGRVPDDPEAVCAPTRRSRAAEALRGPQWASAFEVTPPGGATVHNFLEVADVGSPDTSRMAAAGFALGSGRVGVVGDPDLLQNAVIRVCGQRAGVSMVRLLHYVSSDEDGRRVRNSVIFDEYRHGFGPHPSITRVTRRFLGEHPAGRMLTHLAAAGVILIAAVGTRPAPPAPGERRTRRSPLEHVRALSLAYGRIAATRTATRLLVRGLRRRLRLAAADKPGIQQSDHAFLEHIAQRFPALGDDVQRITRALDRRVSTKELSAVAESIATIERTIASANH